MVNNAVNVEIFDHAHQNLVLIEHAVHGVADADQQPFGQAFQRIGEVIFKAAAGAAGGEPEISRVQKGAAPLGEHLVEAAEDGIAGHADEDQAIFFVRQGADVVRHFVFHLFHQLVKVGAAFGGALEAVGYPQVDGAVGQGVEDGRMAAVHLQHLLPGDVHPPGVVQHLPQAINVEAPARHLLAEGDQFLQLGGHIALIVGKGGLARPCLPAGGARAGHVQGEDGDVVHALPDLGPLDVGVAGVGEDGERRPGDVAHRVLAPTSLDGDVGLHVAANVRRVAVILRLVEIFVRDPAHRGLQGINLREDQRQVKGAQHLSQATHNKDIGRLAAVNGDLIQFGKPLAKQVSAIAVAASYQFVCRAGAHYIHSFSTLLNPAGLIRLLLAANEQP